MHGMSSRDLVLALAVCALVAACASTSDPGLRRELPHPGHAADLTWSDGTLDGVGGVTLYYQSWRPTGEVRGVLVIHHGLADHSDRYAPFAAELVRAGYAVWAFDMRGHGRSSGPRVRGDRIDDYLDDLDRVIALARATEGDRPLFVWGHSFGGLIVALYATERHPAIAGIITAAPALAFVDPPLQLGAIRTLAAIAPGLAALATPHAKFSASAEVNAAMDHDPLVAQGKGPVRTARALIDGVNRVWTELDQLAVPVLALHGDVDQLTAPSGSRDLVARGAGRDRTLRIYPGFAHDLLHQPEGGAAQVTADVRAWLDAHTGGAAWTSPTPAGLPLRGDGGGEIVAIEVAARTERPRDGALGGDVAVMGGLRSRFGRGRAGALGLGWYGGLDVHGGVEDGARLESDLYLVGLSVRGLGGSLLAVTAGIGTGGVRGAGALRVPVELSLEAPAGPLRLFARATAGWRLSGDRYADGIGPADELDAQFGIRLGRDRRYWSTVVAGAGPFLAVGYRNLGGGELYGVSVGTQLWGGR